MKQGVRAEIALLPLRHQMKGFVGVTDNDWFAFLSQQPFFTCKPHTASGI
jgi:hypothetical protein